MDANLNFLSASNLSANWRKTIRFTFGMLCRGVWCHTGRHNVLTISERPSDDLMRSSIASNWEDRDSGKGAVGINTGEETEELSVVVSRDATRVSLFLEAAWGREDNMREVSTYLLAT